MTPYRDASPARRDRTYWTSQPFTTVMSGALAVGLLALGVVLLVAGSSLVTATLVMAAVFGALFQAGVVRLVIDGRRVVLVRGIVGKRAVRSIVLAEDARVQITRRDRAVRAHVVELVTDSGPSVLAECDDPAEAKAIAQFVDPWLSDPRSR